MEKRFLEVRELFMPIETVTNAIIGWSEDGKIIFTGQRHDAPNLKGGVHDFNGLSVIPGFIDIHVHGEWGVEFERNDL